MKRLQKSVKKAEFGDGVGVSGGLFYLNDTENLSNMVATTDMKRLISKFPMGLVVLLMVSMGRQLLREEQAYQTDLNVPRCVHAKV